MVTAPVTNNMARSRKKGRDFSHRLFVTHAAPDWSRRPILTALHVLRRSWARGSLCAADLPGLTKTGVRTAALRDYRERFSQHEHHRG
jgi:predicted NAD/FAD-dependent oxidoreductase